MTENDSENSSYSDQQETKAGVNFCWRNLKVVAKKGNLFRKKHEIQILKNGMHISKYLYFN